MSISEGENGILIEKKLKDEIPEDQLDKSQFSDLNLKDLEILKTIGTGSYGRVVQCRYKDHSKYYALKILEIADIIQMKQVDHTKNEKSLLVQVQHPFIIHLYWTFHDRSCLYLLFEYVCGGELFSYLRCARRFSDDAARFYAAEVVLVLEYLHALCIVYRDLKPENILLDREGHIKITDFGFAKELRRRTWTMCGTTEYVAPEVILEKGYDTAVDWWALGILIFEMLAGCPPFTDENLIVMYEKIVAAEIEWPMEIQPTTKNLIRRLLQPDQNKRLGNLSHEAEDVKTHAWFQNIYWEDVYFKKLKPPFIPKVRHEGDTINYKEYPEKIESSKSYLSEDVLAIFKDF